MKKQKLLRERGVFLIARNLGLERATLCLRWEPVVSELRRRALYLWSRRGLAVAEVANAGEDHRDPQAVCGFDHLVIAHLAARLDDGSCACICYDLESVGEGEESV